MEKIFDAVACITVLAVGVPIVIVFAGWAINVVNVLNLVGEKLEQYVGEKIDKQIYHKQKQLRKEIDGD